MEKVIAFSNRTEGRDKFLKFWQYFSKLMQAVIISRYSTQFGNLFSAVRDCRKFFRLGKSLLEIHYITQILQDARLDSIQRALAILGNASMAIRWIFDNLSFLSAAKVMLYDHKEVNRLATTFWLLGLCFNLANSLREMMKSYAREATLKEASIGKTTRWVVENLDELSLTRKKMILEITKIIGDMIVASNGAQIPYKVLGKQFSEKWVGIGGIVASMISIYQIWCTS
ncbi:unnamed protein product [Blepharisma stoltei]|uniref:Peroxisomal membrane protein 11B n=1 Tax=Blepharisma stoltei TaxID=1481888 RepID=A0AAU9KE42_9CILI|nr:unnamed protein product [Blepharisma stoltei]